MNVFNRIIMVILMLCLIVFSIVTIVNMFFVNLFKWSTVTDSITSYVNNSNPYILTTVLSFVLVIALIILISEFYRRKIKVANIYTDSSGKTTVTLKTSVQQIRESLNNIQGVIDPQVKVVPRQNGIIIDIFSKLVAGVNVTDKTREIRETASNYASTNFGFKVLQTNYTATGFITRKAKEEVKVIKEEEPKEVKQGEQLENKIGY